MGDFGNFNTPRGNMLMLSSRDNCYNSSFVMGVLRLINQVINF